MKKLVFILLLAFSVITGNLFAQSKTPSTVLKAFDKAFSNATNTSWSDVKGLFRVDFLMENEQVTAFFNAEGELIASSRNVTLQQIPLSLKSDLKKQFPHFEISRLFEVDKEEGITYYATVKNDRNQLELESTQSGDWIKK